MAARISNDGMWRVSYGELSGLSRDEVHLPSPAPILQSQVLIHQLIERQPMKYETMLPGNPKPGEYKLTNISPYKIHQRCAEKFRVGRFLLVADAAHLCNPFGGLGLTGGMVDAGNLADCIIGVAEGIADPSIFDKYDEIRRGMWHKIINPVSSDNILRLHDQDPDKALENDEFLITLAKAEKDPELMEQMIVVCSLLRASLMR
jgi:2-polyprenyl-6-methoxyphenol hydroxylase-like FAD-dependent oxidoreductase